MKRPLFSFTRAFLRLPGRALNSVANRMNVYCERSIYICIYVVGVMNELCIDCARFLSFSSEFFCE